MRFLVVLVWSTYSYFLSLPDLISNFTVPFLFLLAANPRSSKIGVIMA